MLAGAKEFYKHHCVEFIEHWCMTYDPRNAMEGAGLPARLPFILFPRQKEFVEFIIGCLTDKEAGLVEKCRDMGATWLCCCISVWLWLFWPGAAIGWGSRKADLVDKTGDPDSIFQKIRIIIANLPEEFLPVGFRPDDHATYMKVVNPETDATITGEAGDNIGRGGRKLIYFKDESAHYERPELIEASLGDNTNVQIDISSVNGTANVFYRRRESGVDWVPGGTYERGKTRVFVFDWRDHPAKTQVWYDYRRKKAEDDGLLHKFAQEVERNYAASVQGIIIKPEWVKAAIDAHLRLDFADDGGWMAALDVADDGPDTNALSKRKGVVLRYVNEWAARDPGVTTRNAIGECKEHAPLEVMYDCIGLGAAVKAEYNRLVDDDKMPKGIRLIPWNAAESPRDKEKHVIPGDKQSPLNEDFFANFKAQAWWQVARKFERTFRAIKKLEGDPEQQDFTWDSADLISIDSRIPLIRKLERELSQAVMTQSTKLKLVVDKAPEGTKSPNLADAVIMNYWPAKYRKPMEISDAVLNWSSRK